MTPETVSVHFEIPAHIRRGLDAGEYVMRGGVIQRRNGPVVAWLREAQGLKEALEKSPEGQGPMALRQALEQLRLPLAQLAGLQALHLGVSLVGFALVMRRLSHISAQLGQVLAGLEAVRAELSWLERREDTAMFARTSAALESAAWAEQTGRLERLVDARHPLTEAVAYHRGLLLAALDAGRAFPHAPHFSGHLLALAQVGLARARCDALLDGPARGASELKQLIGVIANLTAAYGEPVRTLKGNSRPGLLLADAGKRHSVLQLLAISSAQKDAVHHALAVAHGLEARVDGARSELEHCARHALDVREWEALGSDDRSERLLLLVPREEAGPAAG